MAEGCREEALGLSFSFLLAQPDRALDPCVTIPLSIFRVLPWSVALTGFGGSRRSRGGTPLPQCDVSAFVFCEALESEVVFKATQLIGEMFSF